MKGVEAAEVLIEILKECKKLENATFILMPPTPAVSMASGYKIHIETDFGIDKETRACVASVISKHGLISTEDDKGVMIYQKN